MSKKDEPLDLDIDQLLRESAQAAAEYDAQEMDENSQQDLVSTTTLLIPENR